MGQFCGDETPEPLKSSGNVVTIRFKSDASESFYGFGIVYFERNGTSGENHCRGRLVFLQVDCQI